MGKSVVMPKYAILKDSKNKWLGEVPEHWQLIKFKYLASVQKGKLPKRMTSEDNDNLPPYLSMDYLRGGEATQFVMDKDSIVVDENDILLLWDGSNSGEFIKSKQGVISSTVASVKFKNINKSFAWYASSIVEKLLRGSTVGMGIPHVDSDELKNSLIAVPSVAEQSAIANFLDKKTAQIDEAVDIKQQQIELLKERKKIIIQQAVTQGLPSPKGSDFPMKDSGVDWIGKIPDHWEVIRFKNLFTQSRLPVRADDGVVTSFRDGQVTLRSNRRLTGFTEAVIEGGYQGIRKGQLVLNSMDAFEGAIGVSDSDGKCTPEYVICDPKVNNISQHFFAYLLREMALAKYIQVICNAVRQRAVRIRFNNLASRFMVVPPIEEQELIVQHIQNESKKIDDGIEHLKSQIEKFKEYKTTLINSAVTGKIKVPENQESVLS
ncbi:restriction endonuclease subunit S [Vibrio sp. 10N.261.55.B8]|uniref:restriction endonuclease subunit S n=1 Tax=unclassified Vibrio TaxID=2614977 RepID=UPI00354E104C